MLSTVGPELTNFVNPGLSWNKVTKGYRSTAKRTRRSKAGSLNVGAEHESKSPKRVWGSSFFDSDKHGVTALGHQLTDKVEHVPIKKRRLLLRSPSPPPWTILGHPEESLSSQPQTPSPRPEESERILDHKYASGQWFCPDSLSNRKRRGSDDSIAFDLSHGIDGAADGKYSKLAGTKHYYNEDFSGIALLAAAACISSSFDDDSDNSKEDPVVEEFSTPEGFDSSTSTMPLKEVSTRAGDFCHNVMVHEDNMDGSLVKDDSAVASLNHQNEIGEAVRSSILSKDDRLHWDLNTVMDAWEQPVDDPVDIETNLPGSVPENDMQREKSAKFEGCETRVNSVDIKCNLESEVQSTLKRMISDDVHEHQELGGSKSKVLGVYKSKLEELRSSDNDRTCLDVECVSTSNEHAQKPSNCGADSDIFFHGPGEDAVIDNSACGPSHDMTNTFANKGRVHPAIVHNTEDCCWASDLKLGKTDSLGNFGIGKHDVSRPDLLVPEAVVCGNSIRREDDEDFGQTSGLPGPGTLGEAKCEIPDLDNSSCDSTKVDPSYPSLMSVDFPGASDGECLPASIANEKGQDEKASVSDVTENGPSADPRLGGAQCGFDVQESSKCYFEPPANLSCSISDIEHGQIAGAENMAEVQVGYDSPFEDGELRESVVYPWEENEVDDVENECVDYESDEREDGGFGAADLPISDEDEVDCGASLVLEQGSLVRKVTETHFSQGSAVNMQLGEIFSQKDGNGKIEMVRKKGLNASSVNTSEQAPDMIAEKNDPRISHISDRIDEVHIEDLRAGEVGLVASRGKLSSRIEGPSSFDGLIRKNDGPTHRSRPHNFDGSYSRAERDFVSDKKDIGRGRSSLSVHDRNETDGQRVDSSAGYWHPRNSYNYRGPDGPGHPRQRSSIPDSAAKVGGLSCHDHRQHINYPFSSKEMYRPPMRRRSPVDRDDYYSVHRGMAPVRGISRGRSSRGKPGIYHPQGICRGSREEYRNPLPDDGAASSSVRLSHYLARRDRSFSPTFGRGVHVSRPRRRSCSRSRTRSPPLWNLPRDRSLGTRRNSRSPDYRSEARMVRMRVPFQKLSFAADPEGSILSPPPPKGRFSPQRSNSRWADVRNYVDDQLRDRRSPPPGRMFRPSQRFDSSEGYSGRVKADGGYYRSMVRPKRYNLLMAGAGRGQKYDDSDDDRRKHDDRYEMIHRVRRYDACGAVRRFRYDKDEYLEDGRNSHVDDAGSRVSDRRRRSGKDDKDGGSGGTYRYSGSERVYTNTTGAPSANTNASVRVKEEDASSPQKG